MHVNCPYGEHYTGLFRDRYDPCYSIEGGQPGQGTLERIRPAKELYPQVRGHGYYKI